MSTFTTSQIDTIRQQQMAQNNQIYKNFHIPMQTWKRIWKKRTHQCLVAMTTTLTVLLHEQRLKLYVYVITKNNPFKNYLILPTRNSPWTNTHHVMSHTLKLQRVANVLFELTMALSAGKPLKPCKPLTTANCLQANNMPTTFLMAEELFIRTRCSPGLTDCHISLTTIYYLLACSISWLPLWQKKLIIQCLTFNFPFTSID